MKLARVLPHPRLSLVLWLFWVLLSNDLSLASWVLGAVVALVVPVLCSPFCPPALRLVRRWDLAAGYALLVLWDIVVANLQVAMLILLRPRRLQPAFVCVPLALSRQESVAILAATITMTPGTVSCDLSDDGRSLLVHCLDAPDPAGTVEAIKSRYERRLLEFLQ